MNVRRKIKVKNIEFLRQMVHMARSMSVNPKYIQILNEPLTL